MYRTYEPRQSPTPPPLISRDCVAELRQTPKSSNPDDASRAGALPRAVVVFDDEPRKNGSADLLENLGYWSLMGYVPAVQVLWRNSGFQSYGQSRDLPITYQYVLILTAPSRVYRLTCLTIAEAALLSTLMLP